MDKKDTSYLSMSSRVLLVCDQHSELWKDISVMVTLIEEIRNLYSVGNNLLKEKDEAETTGYTVAKNQKFDEMIQKSYILAKKLTSFAQINCMYELIPLVNFSESAIRKGSEKEVTIRCKSIADKALQYIEPLYAYMVTHTEVDILLRTIGEYEILPDKRDSIKSTKKIAGQDIKKVISSLREKLIILDNLIEGVISDENFQDLYFDARIIVDRGTRKNNDDSETTSETTSTNTK